MKFEEIMENKELREKFEYTCKGYYYSSFLKYNMDYDDYMQEQNISLYQKLPYFDESKGDIKGFIHHFVKLTHFNLCKKCNTGKHKMNSQFDKVCLDMEVCEGEDGHSILSGDSDVNISLKYLKENYKNLLTEEEYKIVDLLLMGFNQSQVNKIMEFKGQQIKYKMTIIRKKLHDFVTI